MDKYEVLDLLARGAYGTVHLCMRLSDRKQVVIKEIALDDMSTGDQQESINEVKVVSTFEHPLIVQYYDSFVHERTIKIVMEYLPGGTLHDFLKKRNEELLDEPKILHLFSQLVIALDHIHSHRILHRDLKTRNVLLSHDHKIAKIGDFGISKIMCSRGRANSVVGTPEYLSPEMCEGESYDEKTDVWSLGCVLYELLTLRKPFTASTLAALVVNIMRAKVTPPDPRFSPEIRSLVANMLVADPTARLSLGAVAASPVVAPVILNLCLTLGAPDDDNLPTCSTVHH